MEKNVLGLLKKRNFLPFFLTQFFGAFNDNAFKLTMLTMISYQLTHVQPQSEYYQAWASVLFILPFFLFSATSGQLADKYDKAVLIRLIKCVEVFLMGIGGFALFYGNIFWMMFTLAGMGTHSAFFGPIKYAILPDHLAKNNLLGATGLINASTFIAILFGVTMGTLAMGANIYLAIFMVVFVALAGLFASLFIPSAPSSLPHLKIDLRFWRATFTLLKNAVEHSGILLAILVISWFWLIGVVFMTKLPDYTHYVLKADTTVFSLFLALFSVGIALGSLMANVILSGKVNLSIVPFAMLGFTWFSFDLYWASPAASSLQDSLLTLQTFFTHFFHWRIAFDLLMLAFCSGLFVVPLYTYLEVTSPAAIRARIIATNNIYNSLFMVLGTVIVMVFLHYSATIPQVFLMVSLLNIVAVLLAWIYLKRVI
ncbi:MFS transporter [Legionella sp.]|uniref:MFS transporter n=1 Tax=Legionella sp. TaxID=459 RepID=UPI003CC39893